MTSSYYLKNLIKDEAYLVQNQGDQYLMLDGRCHPDYIERSLSPAGAKICVKKSPGTSSFSTDISKPRSGPNRVRGESESYGRVPRLGLWSSPPDWETRTNYPTLAYGPETFRETPPGGYSQVSVWQGKLRRVPDQPALVDDGYLRQRVSVDGLGFGSGSRQDKYDYLYNFDNPVGEREGIQPRMPRKYNVCDLTQKYLLWKEATKANDLVDIQNNRRIV